jgi:hypothetical protein
MLSLSLSNCVSQFGSYLNTSCVIINNKEEYG